MQDTGTVYRARGIRHHHSMSRVRFTRRVAHEEQEDSHLGSTQPAKPNKTWRPAGEVQPRQKHAPTATSRQTTLTNTAAQPPPRLTHVVVEGEVESRVLRPLHVVAHGVHLCGEPGAGEQKKNEDTAQTEGDIIRWLMRPPEVRTNVDPYLYLSPSHQKGHRAKKTSWMRSKPSTSTRGSLALTGRVFPHEVELVSPPHPRPQRGRQDSSKYVLQEQAEGRSTSHEGAKHQPEMDKT